MFSQGSGFSGVAWGRRDRFSSSSTQLHLCVLMLPVTHHSVDLMSRTEMRLMLQDIPISSVSVCVTDRQQLPESILKAYVGEISFCSFPNAAHLLILYLLAANCSKAWWD